MKSLLTLILLTLSFITCGQDQSWLSKIAVDLSSYEGDNPNLSSVQCFEVTYLSDDLIVRGLLMEPKVNMVYPAIIFNRGGNREFAILSTDMLVSILGNVASEGYVVTASNYRWEDEYGGADTTDVLNLFQITKGLSNVDSNRIGMMGWSRGAMMTCLALKGSCQIQSTVLVSGAPDLFSTLSERPGLEETVFSKYIPDYVETKMESIRDRSPYFWADKLNRRTSLLMLNGTKDRHVDYRQTERFSKRLDSIDFPHEFHVYETNHSFSNMRPELDSILIDWFDRTLKKEIKKVAITIDDVPNTRNFKENGFQSRLLDSLDKLSIPVAIFINEGLLHKGDSLKNLDLLKSWIGKEYVTVGNHTFSHSRYSEVGYDVFTTDIILGEKYTRAIVDRHQKSLKQFRFPYNDLGIDSTQHALITAFLTENNYQITPFTIESSDWMYNALYENYLDAGDTDSAQWIGEEYVEQTVLLFDYFDSLTHEQFGRSVKQIYLCHDNRLNEDYLGQLLNRLEAQGYEFIGLDEAISDPMYTQTDYYFRKWGISWIYRWMEIARNRNGLMRKEPYSNEIEKLFSEIAAEK